MDNPRHRQVCGLTQAHNVWLPETVEHGCSFRSLRFQYVRYITPPFCFQLTSQSFIVMASSNEYTRKILNSPNHAEPCLVNSAKSILCPDNWYVSSLTVLIFSLSCTTC